jgi:hypothetical protein
VQKPADHRLRSVVFDAQPDLIARVQREER